MALSGLLINLMVVIMIVFFFVVPRRHDKNVRDLVSSDQSVFGRGLISCGSVYAMFCDQQMPRLSTCFLLCRPPASFFPCREKSHNIIIEGKLKRKQSYYGNKKRQFRDAECDVGILQVRQCQQPVLD